MPWAHAAVKTRGMSCLNGNTGGPSLPPPLSPKGQLCVGKGGHEQEISLACVYSDIHLAPWNVRMTLYPVPIFFRYPHGKHPYITNSEAAEGQSRGGIFKTLLDKKLSYCSFPFHSCPLYLAVLLKYD